MGIKLVLHGNRLLKASRTCSEVSRRLYLVLRALLDCPHESHYPHLLFSFSLCLLELNRLFLLEFLPVQSMSYASFSSFNSIMSYFLALPDHIYLRRSSSPLHTINYIPALGKVDVIAYLENALRRRVALFSTSKPKLYRIYCVVL